MVDDFRPQQPNEPTDKPDDFQATYENKPETYVTPSGEPTTLSAAPQPSLEIPKKKKSGAGKWLLWGVVVLLLAGLGTFAYWQWSEADTAKKELSSAQSQLETAQADLAKADAGSDDGVDEPVASTPTDKEQIIKVVTANAHATVDSEKLPVTVNVLKQNDKFAYTSVKVNNGAAGEYVEILKKVDEAWVIVYRGQEKPAQTTIDQYGIPAEFQFVAAE